MAEKYSVEPSKENNTKAQGYDPRRVMPGAEGHDDVTKKAQCLHRSRHVSLHVVAEARCSLPLQIGKLDQEPGSDGRRNEGTPSEQRAVVLMPDLRETRRLKQPNSQPLQDYLHPFTVSPATSHPPVCRTGDALSCLPES
jgi:hypothetical protein